MNKQVRSILAQETTKTSKIRQLYLLGIPRAEIARMVTNGNYGFVVNALRRMNEREGGLISIRRQLHWIILSPASSVSRSRLTTAPVNGSHASSGRPVSRLWWKVITIPPVRIGNS